MRRINRPDQRTLVLGNIAKDAGLNWQTIKDQMRRDGRYHVETY